MVTYSDGSTLKSCPFCGQLPKLRYVGNDVKKWMIECVNNKCRIQPFTDLHRHKFVVIREWNRRAP